MPGRIRSALDVPNPYHTASFVTQSPDFQRVKVEIAREQGTVHRAPVASVPTGAPQEPPSSFTSPRKRLLKTEAGDNSPSKRHRPSTDSRGSQGSGDSGGGINSGNASPSAATGAGHHRVASPFFHPGSPLHHLHPHHPSPVRAPPPQRSNSFSIDSIMGSASAGQSPGPPSLPRPVPLTASPLRGVTPPPQAQSPPSTPANRESSPPNVSVTPYARRNMDPSTPIDPH